MAPLKKARNWRLHVLGKNKKTYILDNIYFESLVIGEERKLQSKLRFRDFIKTDTELTGERTLTGTQELLEYMKEITERLADGRARDFALQATKVITKHPSGSECYLRMLTQSEQDGMTKREEERMRRSWERQRPCEICGKIGKTEMSPWGIPATLPLCKKHLYLLFLDSSLYKALALTASLVIFASCIAGVVQWIPTMVAITLLIVPTKISLWRIT